ncbi:MAG TPA: antibiotic biosynthesis monooxygenase [Candidatus Dormibacteraeota bacterium]|nr:antibiotic biosynthesis monooxygenase [Candidatus Dormibacteraeota bacterium]
MVEVFYRYRVHPQQLRAFEHAFGSQGPFAKFFASHPGYRRTRLFKNRADSEFYLCVDVWESKSDWDGFRAAHAERYAQLDRELRLLYLEEHLLGYYEGDEEYQPPIDTSA